MITTVFIDIDNTLLDFEKCSEVSIALTCRDLGIKMTDRFFPVFTEINDGLWHRVEKKEITKAELFDCRFNKIFGRLNIEYDGHEFEKQFKAHLKTIAIPVDGAVDILQYLCGKYKVYAASNSAFAQQYERLNSAGMYEMLDGLLVSDDIGHEKPSGEFFRECFRRIGDPMPSETVMIGDSISADISGGAEYGLHTVWYNHRKCPREDGCMAEYIVDSLAEIKKIL